MSGYFKFVCLEHRCNLEFKGLRSEDVIKQYEDGTCEFDLSEFTCPQYREGYNDYCDDCWEVIYNTDKAFEDF